jgi:hypothetical protein
MTAPPIRAGIALAITIGAFYALGALLAGTFFKWLLDRLTG